MRRQRLDLTSDYVPIQPRGLRVQRCRVGACPSSLRRIERITAGRENGLITSQVEGGEALCQVGRGLGSSGGGKERSTEVFQQLTAKI